MISKGGRGRRTVQPAMRTERDGDNFGCYRRWTASSVQGQILLSVQVMKHHTIAGAGVSGRISLLINTQHSL